MIWLLARSQPQFICVCGGVFSPGVAVTHPLPCRPPACPRPAALLGSLFLKPWPAQQMSKGLLKQLFSLQWSRVLGCTSTLPAHSCPYTLISLHPQLGHSPQWKARTDTYLNNIYARPCRTKHSFPHPSHLQHPAQPPLLPMDQLPPASRLLNNRPSSRTSALRKAPPCCQLFLVAFLSNPERSPSLDSLVS